MSALDDLVNSGGNTIAGGYSFIDADTLRDPKDPKKKYRLQGYDSPEVIGFKKSQPWQDDFNAADASVHGSAGASTATTTIQNMARDKGFHNLVPTGKFDAHNREIVELRDDAGRNFTTEILKSGALDAGKYTKQEDLDAIAVADLFRDQADPNSDWGKAADLISKGIEDESLYGQSFKAQAVDESDVGSAPHLYSSAVQFRRNDRDIRNNSRNPLSDSWNQGWTGVTEAAFGVVDLIGDTTDSEFLQAVGQGGVARARGRLSEYGKTITDYKEVDGFGKAMQYLGNNIALSIPYMAITGAGAAAAPFTGGLSLAAPVSVYTGQVWNEMEGENKNATVAIGAGVLQAGLDRLGLKGVVKVGSMKSMWSEAVDQLVKTGVKREVAEQQLSNATRRELAGLAGDAAKVAKQQLAAKQTFQDLTQRMIVAGGFEGGTEALQEATAYLAAHHTGEGFSFEDLNERIIAGAVAGASIGSAFGAAGKAHDYGAWADVAYRLAPADAKHDSLNAQFAEEEKKIYGRVASVEELAADARARAPTRLGATLEERANADKDRRKGQGTVDEATERGLNISALWQGSTRNIFHPQLQRRSRSARILADMFGGNLQRTFSGSSFESSKHHRVAIYKNLVPIPEKVFSHFKPGKRLNTRDKQGISENIYSQLNAAVDAKGKFDPSLVQDPVVRELGESLNRLSERMYADQKKYNPELGHLDNYLFKYKSLSKKSVEKDPNKFQQLLQSSYGYSAADAKELTDQIRDNPEIYNVDEAFSVVKGGIVPGSHRSRSLNMSENPAFQDFMEQDIFANAATAAKSAARYTAHQDYIGKNGEVISQLLDDMAQEGVDPETINKAARGIQDYLDAESGNYKRPQTDAGKQAIRLQKFFMMLTTIAGLPLATISSFVEAALVTKGLRADQLGGLKNIGEEFAQTLWDGTQGIAGFAAQKQIYDPGDRTAGQKKLRDLGFYEWDVGAATVTGVSEVSSTQQKFYEGFFKWNGLSGWTDFTRAARASIAGDYMFDKAKVIHEHRLSGEPRTREVQEAEEALRNIGLDVDQYVELVHSPAPLTPQEDKFMEDQVREATFNFINEAVALPQAANRPLIYQDPRFALFTQFQGFIATFTANHIPKLWGEYVKRGTPAMKYNAFATMMMMIGIGFASQYLKDLLKYGGKSTPHLEGSEYIQRGIRSSGLLGTGERVLDQFFPLYDQNSQGVGSWVFNSTTGESPAIGYAKNLAQGAGNVIQGEGKAAGVNAIKATPFGPIRDTLKSGWNYLGEKLDE